MPISDRSILRLDDRPQMATISPSMLRNPCASRPLQMCRAARLRRDRCCQLVTSPTQEKGIKVVNPCCLKKDSNYSRIWAWSRPGFATRRSTWQFLEDDSCDGWDHHGCCIFGGMSPFHRCDHGAFHPDCGHIYDSHCFWNKWMHDISGCCPVANVSFRWLEESEDPVNNPDRHAGVVTAVIN